MRRISETDRRSTTWLALVAVSLFARGGAACAQAPATLEVDVSKPGAAIPPEFFGLMTEEINHGYEGGLYAELIQNRSFQDPHPDRRGARGGGGGGDRSPLHWSVIGLGTM